MNYKKVFLIAVLFTGCFSLHAAHVPDHADAAAAAAVAPLQCQICLEPIEHRVEAIWLPCGHVFHRNPCLRGWLVGTDRTPPHNTCPFCRGVIARGAVPLGGAVLIEVFSTHESGAPVHAAVPVAPSAVAPDPAGTGCGDGYAPNPPVIYDAFGRPAAVVHHPPVIYRRMPVCSGCCAVCHECDWRVPVCCDDAWCEYEFGDGCCNWRLNLIAVGIAGVILGGLVLVKMYLE